MHSTEELIEALYTSLAQGARAELVDRAKAVAGAVFMRWPVATLHDFRSLMSAELSVTLEFVASDDDLARIAERHQACCSYPLLGLLLNQFRDSRSDGLLLRRDAAGPGDRAYVAVIDARDERAASRAYFTAWHEIAHVLVARSAPSSPAKRSLKPRRDPLESVVDEVASWLGFFEPIFGPVVEREEAAAGVPSFAFIERTRQAAVPDASLQATAIAVVRSMRRPCVLLTVALDAEGSLTVRSITRSHTFLDAVAVEMGQEVASESIVSHLFGTRLADEKVIVEDAGWWGGSNGKVTVAAVSRAEFVYALLSPG